MAVGAGRRPALARDRRHPGLLGLRHEVGRHGRDHIIDHGGPLSLRGPRPLERPRHAGGRQRRADADENRAHFSFWALFAAPLMAGNDLTTATPETMAILTNREVIAVDQDPLGMQGRKVRDNGPQEVWMKPLADGSRAVILFNRGTAAGGIAVTWEEIGLAPRARPWCAISGKRPTWARSPAASTPRSSPTVS